MFIVYYITLKDVLIHFVPWGFSERAAFFIIGGGGIKFKKRKTTYLSKYKTFLVFYINCSKKYNICIIYNCILHYTYTYV